MTSLLEPTSTNMKLALLETESILLILIWSDPKLTLAEIESNAPFVRQVQFIRLDYKPNISNWAKTLTKSFLNCASIVGKLLYITVGIDSVN